MCNIFRDKRQLLILVAITHLLVAITQRATVLQIHYVVDHPKVGE